MTRPAGRPMLGPAEGKSPLTPVPMVWLTTPCCGNCRRHRQLRVYHLWCGCGRGWIVEMMSWRDRRRLIYTEMVIMP